MITRALVYLAIYGGSAVLSIVVVWLVVLPLIGHVLAAFDSVLDALDAAGGVVR
ncbi:MAG: hypothetical protein AB1627_01155 [Chloroflexota bacterium]